MLWDKDMVEIDLWGCDLRDLSPTDKARPGEGMDKEGGTGG